MKQKHMLKVITYCLSLSIVGIFILYISTVYINDNILSEISKAVCISIITAALLTIVINFFQRDYFEEKFTETLETKLPFMDKLNKIGIIGFDSEFPLKSAEYTNSFLESDTVTLVFNDGKRFFQNNSELFKKRFSKKDKCTRFIFMNPYSNDSISVLTRKNGHEGDYYKNKIEDFISYLKKEAKQLTDHKIEIYTHDLFTTMSVILTERYAMFSLYRISPGQNTVPHITVERNNSDLCEYEKILDDIEKLIKKSQLSE
ncbi:hypothetical protein [Aeromonas veronii]|uniref:hypothetical protein n=1 Tax=Aeromonas veronii TaxID=654 RepID=UPI002936F11A|nr:hypothetical protein [Aeromonas veronii]WOE83717.1 hypothetical protein RY930_16825 [Aeromonas veronii]